MCMAPNPLCSAQLPGCGVRMLHQDMLADNAGIVGMEHNGQVVRMA